MSPARPRAHGSRDVLHDADNALFDAACELLEDARTIAALAAGDDAAAAIPATLACVEEALWALAEAAAALPAPRGDEALPGALRSAARACGAARAARVAQPRSRSSNAEAADAGRVRRRAV